jgi:hypothetical protein
MTDNTACSSQFVERLLTDLGLNFFQIGAIGLKLENIVNSYNKNKSTTTLHDLSDELYNCIKPHLNTTAITTGEEFGFLLIYFSIITAITLIIVVIVFMLLRHSNKGALIAIIIGVCLFYIVIGILLIHHNFNIILNNIIYSEDQIMLCINKAISDLENLVRTDEEAFDKALCAYGSA